jgi:DNA-binding transcriptional regulator GbsR (MarR family)
MGGYRTTDPATAKLAYEQMVRDGSLSRRRLEIARAMVGDRPQTAGEIAEILGSNRNNVATRLTEMEHMEVVRKVAERRCMISGKTCWTWELTGGQPTGKIERPESKTVQLKQRIQELEEENARLKARISADRGQLRLWSN